MSKGNIADISREHPQQGKILLAVMPFWPPLIPPMGIIGLKSSLQQYGYDISTVDANLEPQFQEAYNNYLETLNKSIPGENRGNFYMRANDVLKNHLMAHINYNDEKEYTELVKTLIFKSYYCIPDDEEVSRLNHIISGFYSRLAAYIIYLLEKEKPTILGISVFNISLPASMFAFKLTREKFPHIKTVMGGGVFADVLIIGSPNFESFLKKAPFIDKFFVGEGEILFLKYLRGELSESQRVYTLKDIAFEIVDLNTQELPDFSDLALNYYPYLGAYASRSCQFQCHFCNERILFGKYRKKCAKKFVGELIELYSKHHRQLFLLCDSLLNPVVSDLAPEFVKSGISIYWDGYLRPDQSVRDTARTMLWRKAGFYKARLGLESGSQRVLDLMNKKITVQQMKAALSSLSYAGIKTCTLWVVGFPGETEADFQQTLDFIEELKDDIYEVHCNPYNYILNSNDWVKGKKILPIYPEAARELLIFQYWTMACEPSREETYRRVNRFVQHCQRLGIPSPYQLKDTYKADERWKSLQKNAGPGLLEFSKRSIINENITIEDKKIHFANNNSPLEEISFGF